MTVTSLFPILATPDLPRLVAFYEAALCGSVTYRFPHEDGGDAYVSLSLGGAPLGIGRDAAATSPAPADRIAIWCYVDDVDATHAQVVEAGGASRQEPSDMPWGERVAQVHDPDGNLLHLALQPT
ncbi:VOC family protein [Microbacterium sp. bgisy189]|uniref:VOC family protein n=1 Tax=Microbacterium sp. bgisy189 TaxID=3413798 RepID=UPI003EB95CC1